jgi:hypothetical protein
MTKQTYIFTINLIENKTNSIYLKKLLKNANELYKDEKMEKEISSKGNRLYDVINNIQERERNTKKIFTKTGLMEEDDDSSEERQKNDDEYDENDSFIDDEDYMGLENSNLDENSNSQLENSNLGFGYETFQTELKSSFKEENKEIIKGI